MRKYEEGRTIVADMIEACSPAVGRTLAVRGIRAVCGYFGGQLLYIPKTKTSGDTIKDLNGVLFDAVGESASIKIFDKLTALYGGCQIYLPKESRAFRDVLVREIYERYNGHNLRELCREYDIAFTTVYRHFHEGREEKAQGKFYFAEDK